MSSLKIGANFDVFIVDAGVASLRAAIAIADKGHKVRVLERQARLQWPGSVIGIIPSGTRVLEQYGVLEDVWRACGDRGMTMSFCRWEDGSVPLKYADHAKIWRLAYTTPDLD